MKPMSGCPLLGADKMLAKIQDAVILQHSVIGCSWGAMALQLDHQLYDIRHASTVVYEEEVIRGGAALVSKGLREIDRLYPQAQAVFLLSGCVPNLIGDDVEECLRTLETQNNKAQDLSAQAEANGANSPFSTAKSGYYRTPAGKKIVHISAPGYVGTEKEGAEQALAGLLALMDPHKAADRKKSLTERPSVNLIGLTGDTPYALNDLRYLQALLRGQVDVVCTLPDCTIQEIEKMPSASLNLVFGYGKALALKMEEDFHIPFLACDYPYGVEGVCDFLRAVEKKLDVSFTKNIEKVYDAGRMLVRQSAFYLSRFYQRPAALIGDSVHFTGMKKFLERELGMDVVIALETNEADQNELERLLQEKHPEILFASSYEKQLAERYRIPLIRYAYPLVDEVCFTGQPLAGAEGAAFLLQKTVNTVLQMPYKKRGLCAALIQATDIIERSVPERF